MSVFYLSFVPDPLDLPALSFVLFDELDFGVRVLAFLPFLPFFTRTTLLLPLELFPCETFELPLAWEPLEFLFPLLGLEVEGDEETLPELPFV